MNELTPIQKLDKVLEWFAMDIKEMGIGEQSILRERVPILKTIELISKYFKELNTAEFIIESGLILEQLADDGNIKKEGDLYSITFKGKYFSKNGGYTQKNINNASESIRLDNLEHRQKRYEQTQTLLLTLVSVGTLISAVYYLIEIGKHFHWWK